MTAALNLPDRQEWTVDDLGELPKDLRYELAAHTDEVFTTGRPWQVTLDLPALTARRAALAQRDQS